MKVLVTGAAGFIGIHVARRLLERGVDVVGIGNLNDYYYVGLKEDRLKQLFTFPNFRFAKLDMADRVGMDDLFGHGRFESAVNSAARGPVFVSEPPRLHQQQHRGFPERSGRCRNNGVEHRVFASSSSV
jgi:UDP-glucuronate 4-epimerase